jgi:hypothetical protein
LIYVFRTNKSPHNKSASVDTRNWRKYGKRGNIF